MNGHTGRKIFITGASGFLGGELAEQLGLFVPALGVADLQFTRLHDQQKQQKHPETSQRNLPQRK